MITHRPAGIGVHDEARTIRDVRTLVQTDPPLWERWTPGQRISFVLSRLLNLQGATPGQRRTAHTRLGLAVQDPRMLRRGREILAAVALVDHHPPHLPPVTAQTTAPS